MASKQTKIERLGIRIDTLSQQLGWLPPLSIRVVLGVTFVLSGWGKLHDLGTVTRYFESLGIPAAGVQATFVSGVELVGGLLVLFGLGTRVAALLLTGVMAVAIATAIWPQAPDWTAVLGSLEAIYLAAFVALIVGGAGAASLDHLARRLTRRVVSLPTASIAIKENAC